MFDSKYVGSDGYLRDTNGAKFTYTMKEKGVYLVEVNYDTGFAAVIHPVSNGDVFAILPNEYDSTTIAIEKSQEIAVANTLASINTLRKAQGLSTLTLDTTLSELAAYKAKDMADHNYVGHADSQGKFILDTAKRAGIKVS